MRPEAVFEAWVPPGGLWSIWARPVLFAQLVEQQPPELPPVGDLSWAPAAASNPAIVLDVAGDESVRTGVVLAGHGYRPVPLYNACTGPNEVIDQLPILRGLQAGAAILAAPSLPAGAPPAFLLDALRLSPSRPIGPGVFDNRWMVFPQDFPSGRFLIAHGVSRVLLVQRGRRAPLDDLAHVLCRWQEAGLALHALDLAESAPAAPLVVDRPPSYRSICYRADAAFGLHPSATGGFGSIVPQPSHG
jgi:hypothetical protein